VPAGACNPATNTFDLCSTSRIDFAATAAPNQNFYDLLYGGNANTMTRFGAGTYTYDISGLPLDQTISFALWTSAFVQVNPGQLAQGGSYSFFSNYGSTYELAGIDLFDAAGARITDWTLVDDVTGTTVFTSAGRIDPSAVPEPGTLALFGAALVGVGLARRRRDSGVATA
jgi:hypothetical protein